MTPVRVAVLVFWAAAGSSAAELTAEQWRADLTFLANELPQRHKNLYHQIPRSEFERKVKELDAAIPHLSEIEIRAGITRLVAAVGDNHTGVSLTSDRVFDLSFMDFPEGLFVIGAAKEYGDAIGARVVSIDGTSPDEARKRLSVFIPAVNEFSARAYSALMPSVAALQVAGIIQSTESAEFVLEKNGHTQSMRVRSRQLKDPRPERVMPGPAPPLYMKQTRTFYWWEYLADAKTLYIQYNSCQEMPSLSFQRFTDQIVEQVARQAPEKIVVDLRHNGGGASNVWNPLLNAMRTTAALRPPGGIYVLTSLGTGSSGFLNAIELREQFAAMVAGEASMERPNHYGYVQTFRLPNSRLSVSYAVRHFFPLEDDPPALLPDLRVPITAADYFADRDPVLAAVLKLPASIETNFRDAIARDPANHHAYAALARIYAEQGRMTDVMKLLKDGIAANPRSAFLWIALSELHTYLKNFQGAEEALNAALKVDPASAAALYELGTLSLAQRKYQAAESAFRQCYRLETENLRGLKGVVDVYVRQKKAVDAIPLLIEEADRNPDNIEVRLYAGKFAAAQGKFDVAVAQYQKEIARSIRRMPFESWADLSEIYRHKGDAAAAVRIFQVGWDATSENVREIEGGDRMILGAYRGYYEPALRHDPNDGVLLTNISFLLAKVGTGAEISQARDLAERARKALPELNEVADNLGCIYVKTNQPDHAVELFREVVRKEPSSPIYRYHLGMALNATGNHAAALKQLREGLKNNPSPDLRAQIEELLAVQ
jgi:tetratricopeptide (TPR) repeat protein